MPSLSDIAGKLNQLLAYFQQHQHTGTDSPKISYNNLLDVPTSSGTYAGSINADASTNVIPTGWTVAVGTGGSVGQYTITHNLNTTKYSAVGNLVGLSYANYSIITKTVSANSCVLETFALSVSGSVVSATPTDAPFVFVLNVNP
jgi:hypothetical protein